MSTVIQLTDEQYLNLPEEPGKQELLDGELISLPPAKDNHSELALAIVFLLASVLDRSRLRHEAGFRLKRGWLIPDVAVTWPDQPVDEWLLASPMIAIEIASRGNTAYEINRKVIAYLEEGAAEVWVIYPQNRSMSVFRKDGWLSVTGIYRCELIGIDINLDELLPAAG